MVEDDVDFREVVCLQLRKLGIQVVEAGDAGAAWARTSSYAIRAAVVDLRLPGIDGKTLARQLRSILGPSVPIVAFTAWPVEALSGGTGPFDAVLSKPEVEPVVALLRGRLGGAELAGA